jgi:hypothetical protein
MQKQNKYIVWKQKISHQEFIAGFWQQETNHRSWSCCAQWYCCGIQLLLKSTSSCVRSLWYSCSCSSCWCIVCNYSLFLPKTWKFHHKWIHEHQKNPRLISSCNWFVSWSWGFTGFQFTPKSLHLCTNRYIAVLMHINSAAQPCPKCSSTLKLFRLGVLVGLSVSLLLPATGLDLRHPQVTGFGLGHPQATGFDLSHVKVTGSSLGHPWVTGSSLGCPWETGSNSGCLWLIKSDLFCQQATKFLICGHSNWKFSTSMHTGLKICSPHLFLVHIQMKLHMKERVMCNTYIPHTPLSWILCHCSIRKMCVRKIYKSWITHLAIGSLAQL